MGNLPGNLSSCLNVADSRSYLKSSAWCHNKALNQQLHVVQGTYTVFCEIAPETLLWAKSLVLSSEYGSDEVRGKFGSLSKARGL